MLKKILAATNLMVSVDRAKVRLHIDTSDFDADLEDLIIAATAALETQANITLRQSSWEYRIPDEPFLDYTRRWPLNPYHMHWTLDRGLSLPLAMIKIPSAPVRDVTAVKYLDTDDVEQTIDPTQWSWERTPSGADVTFVRDFVIPAISLRPQAIRVAFDAGYDDPAASGSGDDPELIFPPQAEMAILFLVAHWHTNRTSAVVDSRAAPFEIPQTFDFLAQQLRVHR